MEIKKIYIGGWYQRTTLHLSEVWDFLQYQHSDPYLSPQKLNHLRQNLQIASLERLTDSLEYIKFKTGSGITCRIYEDGLIVLKRDAGNIVSDMKHLQMYFESNLGRALSYIFSRGAPVPKELAGIKTVFPFIITTTGAGGDEVKSLFAKFKEQAYSKVEAGKISVYRCQKYMIINDVEDENFSRELIEANIFFREFKNQLHRYLVLHRNIWEKIRRVKERDEVRASEVQGHLNELRLIEKTVLLIDGRIGQMDSYAKTRQKLSSNANLDEYLKTLFQFKYETLLDTHSYIQKLWGMTKTYLASALTMFQQVSERSTTDAISILQIITTIGIISGIVGLLYRDALPKVNMLGFVYVLGMLAVSWVLYKGIKYVYTLKKYKLDVRDYDKDIQ
ncbi:MAG TPA: hypothetical protein VEA59_04230 [Patescibacteria group bacterium]|nr:hypothetical protein [Patescibacteria group bacterium]